MTEILEKVYDPPRIEAKWYEYWEGQGLFHAKADGAKPGYCIVIPPPNVTGVLHMGHALNNTLQDILIRFKRMDGFDALWMPGTDHAGIATQNVVERQLAAEGKDRHALGREAFIKRVWEWKAASGGHIITQLKRLGCSCDWSRERFTMDEGLSRAVREVFVRLYEEGLIYKGDYIINGAPAARRPWPTWRWSTNPPTATSTISSTPWPTGDGSVTVATTRPETLLGDTAVAVNPEDKRYKKFHGATLRLPVLGRPIPVITDAYVALEFGTGALKITPAHDFNDFEVARRHDLPAVKVIDEAGLMTAAAGKYQGMDRFACRDPNPQGPQSTTASWSRSSPTAVPVGHCYRCKTVVEPLVSKQWFVAVKTLASRSRGRGGRRPHPADPPQLGQELFRLDDQYPGLVHLPADLVGPPHPGLDLRRLRPGHRQPGRPGRLPLRRATWPRKPTSWTPGFLRPCGPSPPWAGPTETPELKLFYPTSVLVTAFDILFFWVARMMMMGIHFMGEVPFREVYIHALVRDPEGQKMSKSKGNVIDPLDLMDKYGTDAFRFSLAAFAAMGRDVRLSEERIAGYRNFANKVWNACRFTFMNLEGFDPATQLATQMLTLTKKPRWRPGS